MTYQVIEYGQHKQQQWTSASGYQHRSITVAYFFLHFWDLQLLSAASDPKKKTAGQGRSGNFEEEAIPDIYEEDCAIPGSGPLLTLGPQQWVYLTVVINVILRSLPGIFRLVVVRCLCHWVPRLGRRELEFRDLHAAVSFNEVALFSRYQITSVLASSCPIEPHAVLKWCWCIISDTTGFMFRSIFHLWEAPNFLPFRYILPASRPTLIAYLRPSFYYCSGLITVIYFTLF